MSGAERSALLQTAADEFRAQMDELVDLTVAETGALRPIAKQLHPGGSAYSCLTILSDESIGLLYEKDGYRSLAFAHFDLDWLTDGQDKRETKSQRNE